MAERHEIKGLDTLRFVAATIVALSHGAAFPLTEVIGKGAGWVRVATAVYDVSFDGAAAVIVFFVISGFCIHLGPASGAPFRTGPFLLRRGLRIAPPLLAALGVAAVLGASARAALSVVLWSIYCELAYYALYPLLRLGFRRFGVARVLAASCMVSVAMIVLGWRAPFYRDFPVWATWLLAAPAWLLGCLLAERVAARGPDAGPSHVWVWRLLVWSCSALATALYFHSPIRVNFPALLFPFQFLAYAWVFAEIRQAHRRGASRLLDWCGRWSYSLYLIHNIVIAATPLSTTAVVWTWTLRLALIVGGSLVFYVLVEAPSHRLARFASRWWAGLARKGGAAAPELAAP